jgi:mono/diheme cytochrome c family protein/uncharacterized coiled-coil protein SlyX
MMSAKSSLRSAKREAGACAVCNLSRSAFVAAAIIATVVVAPLPAFAQDAEAAKVTYVDHIQPIFRQHCFSCHGPDTQKNDLALHNYASAMTGGASGEVVFAGDADGSYLWQLVNHDAEPAMPPGGNKLPQTELDLIKAWIMGGLLEKGDSVARKSNKPAVAAFTPSADNRPEGDPAMPQGVSRDPVIEAPQQGAAVAIATSPWAPLAAVGASFQVSLYHTDTGELLGVLPFTEGSPFVLRFTRDGGLLMVAGGRPAALGVVALFDVKTGKRLTTVGDELDAVMAADVSPNHGLVAMGGPRKIVRVHRVADGSQAYEITKHTDWITAAEFSPDGKFLLTADRSGGMWLWDAETGRERGELRGHAEQVTSVSWRGDSAVVATASEDDTVRLWQIDGVQIKSWGAHGGGAASVQFAREGHLVSAGRDQRVRTWQSDGAAIKDLAGMEDLALSARFTHDGKRIVAADLRGNVQVIDAESGSVALTLDPTPPSIEARFAALEAEVGKIRLAAQQSGEQAASAEQLLASAQSALDQARAAVEQRRKEQADSQMQLAAIEQQLAAVSAERTARQGASATIVEQLAALRTELEAAAAGAAAATSQQEASAAAVAQQQAVIGELNDQIAKLRETLQQAKEQLATLDATRSSQEDEAAAATARVDELAAQIAELERSQAELKAIEDLRVKYDRE